MNGRKDIKVTVGFVLAVSLIAASLTNLLCRQYDSRAQFRMLGEVCREILQRQPEAEGAVAAALKACSMQGQESGAVRNRTKQLNRLSEFQEAESGIGAGQHLEKWGDCSDGVPESRVIYGLEIPRGYQKESEGSGQDFLMAYGYQEGDFLVADRGGWVPGAIGFLAGAALFLLALQVRRRRDTARIQSLTEYLENVNTGGKNLLLPPEEDAFSGLQDEIYKTVTALYQTRDAALQTRDNFAENLSNIAHQIKTPITSISLSVQMQKEYPSPGHLEQISQQLSRLTQLEEALLLLARMEAGTLPLAAEQVDVFTLLTLAGDNLQELLHRAQVSLHIPEDGEMAITADLEWTMEAVMNLMKNCLEHTPPGGRVSCSYEQNPLYTQIRIWDSGSGFAKEDLPRLFERFYRGAGSGGIGIGLSLAKEIIERQNGTISARNLAGGACFEILMYSH